MRNRLVITFLGVTYFFSLTFSQPQTINSAPRTPSLFKDKSHLSFPNLPV